jgi:hypothetical protein
MKDPERLEPLERLISGGSDEERRLLRAAQAVRVPERTREEVRRAVEARLHSPPHAPDRRLRWAAAGVLVATAAAAAGLPVAWRALRATRAPEPPPALPAPPPCPVIVPVAPPPPAAAEPALARLNPPGPAAAAAPHAPPPPTTANPAPAAPPVSAPGLDLPGFLRGGAEPAPPPAATPPPPTTRLVIARSDRREVSLEVTATAVRGEVRGRPVALTLKGNHLTGQIGGDAVNIHIFANRQASGSVGGRELEFTFIPTERGWLVDAALPDVLGRVRVDPDRLSFHPGCGRDLLLAPARPAVAPAVVVYQGTCSDDTRLRIELPPALPASSPGAMARLVVLAMLLPEPDPDLRGHTPGLFPPP